MKPRSTFRLAVTLSAALFVHFVASSAFAATRYWDGGSADIAAAGNGSGAGGDGTWNITTKNWDQGTGLAHVAWNNANNDVADWVTGTANITLGADIILGGINQKAGGGATSNSIEQGSGPYTLTLGITGSNTFAIFTGTTARTLVVNATIAGASGKNFLLSGGNLTLNRVNTFAGNITISGSSPSANLTIGSSGQLGSGSYAGTISIASGCSLIYSSSADQTLGGIISGSGNLTKGISSASNLTLSAPNTYTGVTTITAGKVSINTIKNVSGGSSALGAPVTAANGLIALGGAATTGTLIYTGAVQSTDRTIRIGTNSSTPAVTDTGGSTIENNGTDALTFSATTFNTQTNATSGVGADRILTLQGSSTANNTISGIIRDNLATTGTARVGLTKAGAGTWVLDGANTYTGTTTFSEGILALGASGTIDNTSGIVLGGGTFDVSAKAGGYTVSKLTGSGTVAGALTVSGELAIGTSPGTIGFESLTLGSASTYTYDLTGGGITADLGNVSGTLTLGGGTLGLVQLGTYTLNDKFTLFGYQTGNLTGTFAGLADGATFTDAGGLWKIDYDDTGAGLNGGTGTSFTTITAVPEPRAALLGGLGLLALLRRRR